MPAPVNRYKQRLAAGETLFGCWLSLADAAAAEMLGTAGFDWLVIDGEHATNDIRSIRDQLIALEGSPSDVIVRVPWGETWIIKQVLDAGAQSILVPMVESGAQARELVRACRYPPEGNRGVGAAAARASRFSAIPDYIATADAQISLTVQVESRAGIAALDEILTVEGVDCVFIGPADLASDLGHRGNAAHPQVQEVIHDTLGRIAASGKAAGIMSVDDARTPGYLESGARMVAVAIDVPLLMGAARAKAGRWIDAK